jgi:16S rRNA (cytosine967-C5)-methyltransferase
MTEPNTVRALAAGVVDEVLASRHPATRPLDRAERICRPRDRALLHELVLGTLRWLRRLDFVIEAASSRRLSSIDPPLRTPLRLAAYQILFLDRIPFHAAVHEAVDEARRRTHRGGGGFVNAVLRKISGSPQLEAWSVSDRDPIRRLGIETSHPDLLVERWHRIFGDARTREILQANNIRKPWQILTFRHKGGREATAHQLAEEGVQTVPSKVAPLGLVVTVGSPLETSALARGDVYLQDEASQAAALVPPPSGPERIVDLAAAPGGKSLSLKAWDPELELVAADWSLERLGTLRENKDRLAVDLDLLQADGRLPPFRDCFDRVVLDLPCTGTGTLRKHPELKWRIQTSEIERLSSQGLHLVEAGAELVRPGGLLVVITCSLEPEENFDVITEFLRRRGGFERVALQDDLPEPLDDWIVGPGSWQILPADAHDGFTVHALRRDG